MHTPTTTTVFSQPISFERVYRSTNNRMSGWRLNAHAYAHTHTQRKRRRRRRRRVARLQWHPQPWWPHHYITRTHPHTGVCWFKGVCRPHMAMSGSNQTSLEYGELSGVVSLTNERGFRPLMLNISRSANVHPHGTLWTFMQKCPHQSSVEMCIKHTLTP